ncbi:hypothetical protein [uncultured Nostoc sp.]|uniref:hypothetical protein n=1 Tax=uncultured Nostoc sp. TaxID=340711 RepID=UPI0035CAB17B
MTDIKTIVEAHALELKTKYYVIFQDDCSIMEAFNMIRSKARLIVLLDYTPKQNSLLLGNWDNQFRVCSTVNYRYFLCYPGLLQDYFERDRDNLVVDADIKRLRILSQILSHT